MLVYDRLREEGEKHGLPGLEQYAFFLLEHPEIRIGSGMFNFGLKLGGKKEESQSGD